MKGGRIDHRLKRSISGSAYLSGSTFDSMVMDDDLVHFHSPALSSVSAVSFTTSTTQKWRDHRIPGSETLHVIPPPPFIVNHNHLEKSPESVEDNFESVSDGSSKKRQHKETVRKTPQATQKKPKPAEEHKVGKRSAGVGGSVLMLVNVTLLQYLDTGRWFLSVYNDDLRPHQVTLVVAEAEGVSTACPNDCSGHGSCYLGKCDCIDGYEGIDCSKSK